MSANIAPIKGVAPSADDTEADMSKKQQDEQYLRPALEEYFERAFVRQAKRGREWLLAAVPIAGMAPCGDEMPKRREPVRQGKKSAKGQVA